MTEDSDGAGPPATRARRGRATPAAHRMATASELECSRRDRDLVRTWSH
jgi:hypothetical protein